MSSFFKRCSVALLFAAFSVLPTQERVLAQTIPKVVVSIKPLHSIISAVMEGVGEPVLLLPPGASPHNATLRPSQARQLQDADIVFRVGKELEGFLDKPLSALTGKQKIISLIDADGITFPQEEKGHDGDRGDEHDDDHKDEHADESAHEDEHGHHGHDAHIWLNPANAIKIANAAAKDLASIDAKNGTAYAANAKAFAGRIGALDASLKDRLAPFAKTPFITLHDGYGHFQARYGLIGGRAISITPQTKPGAAKLRDLQNYIEKHAVRCAFSEPQFSPNTLRLVASAGAVNISVLDPLGSGVDGDQNLYETLLTTLADSLIGCLKQR